MKIALLGFNSFPEQEAVIKEILATENHQIVKIADQADMLIVPHHMDHLFPPAKPWIAIWLNGGVARLTELFRELANKPIDLIPGFYPNPISGGQRTAFINAVKKIHESLKK